MGKSKFTGLGRWGILSALLVVLWGGVVGGTFAGDVKSWTIALKSAKTFTFNGLGQCPATDDIESITPNGTGAAAISGGNLADWLTANVDGVSCADNIDAVTAVAKTSGAAFKLAIKAAVPNANQGGTALETGDVLIHYFSIAKLSLSTATIALHEDNATITYDGTAKTPKLVISGTGFTDVDLSADTAATTFVNNTNAHNGTATNPPTATVSAKSTSVNYTGSKTFTFAIQKAALSIGENVDTSAVLKAWLDTVKYVSLNEKGAPVAKSAPAADGIVAKGGYTLTNATQSKSYWKFKSGVTYDESNAADIANYDSTGLTAFADTGKYALVVWVRGGANITDGQAFFPYSLEYSTFVSSPIITTKRVVYYTKSNIYSVDWPAVGNAAFFGTLDSIYEFTGSRFLADADASWDSDAFVLNHVKIKLDKTKRSVSFTLEDNTVPTPVNVNGVGVVRLYFKARGVTAGADKRVWIWPSADGEYDSLEVQIAPKALESSYITLTDYPIVYSGDTVGVDELRKKFFVVHEGILTGAADNDYSGASNVDYVIVPWWSGVADVSDWNGPGLKNTLNLKDAGANKAWIVIQGKGNYSGRALKAFTIERAPVNATVSVTGGSKVYDGKPDIATEGSGPKAEVLFSGSTPALTAELATFDVGADFEFRSAKYSDSVAGVVCSLTARVALSGNSDKAQNFRFAGASPDSVTLKAYGLTIAKRELQKTDVNFSIPANHYYNGQQRGVGAVSLKTPLLAGSGATVATLYRYPVGMLKPDFNPSLAAVEVTPKDTTFVPKSAGSYGVLISVKGSQNIADIDLELTDYENPVDPVRYTINPPAGPVITYPLVTDTRAFSVRQGRSVNLKVSAKSPNAGVLSYKWFTVESDGITSTIKPMNIPGLTTTDSVLTISVSGEVGTSASYCAVVTNTAPSGVQDPRAVADTAEAFTVTVDTPPISMVNAKVAVNPEKVWYYTGYPVTPQGTDVTVSLPSYVDGADTTWTPIDAVHYSLAYVSNVNVGTATLRASAVSTGNYQGTATTTFAVAKKQFGIVDIAYTESRVYTGDTLSALVKENPPMTGMGEISVRYDTSETVPVNAGDYDVYVNVTGGDNVSSSGGFQYLGVYTIKRVVPVAGASGNLSYKDPASLKHVEGDSSVSYGIGDVTLKNVEGYTGAIAVLYNGDDEVPVTAGQYTVTADISGDDNVESALLTLGIYTIKGKGDAVAESNREIPVAPVVATVSVAPVKATASGFTAGPSPVSKNGAIKFFSAKVVKSGSLYIFNASGDAVAKVSANSGSGEIGSWNLKDNKGVPVAEGTYVIKGALAGKDGTREKVSFVFSVVK